MGKAEDISDEDISKTYHSDNEEEDKWNNMEKACWDGYEQRGMKDKGGRKVPNCVYVGKSVDTPKEEAKEEPKQVKLSIFGTEGPQKLIPKNKQ